MKPIIKLPLLTLSAALISATSVYALERAAPQLMAQAGPDDERGPRGEPSEAPPEAPRERSEPAEKAPSKERKGEAPEERAAPRERGGKDDEGATRPQRERPAREEGAPERRERPAREKDAQPRERAPREEREAEPTPAKPERPAKSERRETPAEPAPIEEAPPAVKEAPVVPKERPPAAKEDVPAKAEPKEEPKKAPEPAERREPPKADSPPAKDERAPEPKVEPPAPPAAEPGPKGSEAEPPRKREPNADGRPRGEKGAEPARREGAPPVAPSDVKDLKEVKEERKERKEDGGKRVVIEEPDNRVIVKEGGKTIIRADETERFRRLGGKERREKRNGLDISINIRPGGIEIFTETDDRGRPLRRYRRGPDGREVILFDNRDYYRRHHDGSFVDAIVDLPPPRIVIPRQDYIVDYEEASDADVYDALAAPPIERLDRSYSLEEVRRSPMLRDRMRRIDLDVINFNFGAWDVAPDQYGALGRIAKAMLRVIDRNPNEMFLIEGHTDAVGSDEDNLSLSDRRAESVAIILTDEFGVPPENLTTQGYGEQYLKIATEAPERQNRRVAVRRITPLLSRGD